MANVAEVSTQMRDIKAQLDAKKKESTELQKEFDRLRKEELPAAMEEAGIESVRVTGIGTVSLRTDAYVSIVAGKKDEAYQWLQDNGFGDLVQDFVQSSTLKAFVKEQAAAGMTPPEELFKYDPYTYATITKR